MSSLGLHKKFVRQGPSMKYGGRLIEKYDLCGWINYVGRPVRPTRYQPGATPWESVMCDCRPERAKALPKHHSFALSGRIYPFPTTQGVALGYELVALSGRFNRIGRNNTMSDRYDKWLQGNSNSLLSV